jgi:pSer/pThr/pTyr-binding forkhead associated (FHA) protein
MGPPPGMGGPPPGMGGPPPGMGAPGGPPPGFGPPPGPPGSAAPAPGAGNMTCPRCGSSTPTGFAFCQQCGMKLDAPAPAPAPGGGGGGSVDAFGGTIAAMGPEVQGLRAGVIGGGPGGGGPGASGGAAALGSAPTPAAMGTWGQAVSVNRDGSDGERFPLGAEYVVFGRAGADVAFDQDRFLARQHARLERTGDGARIVPLDQVNGVFRKLDAQVELADGMIVLLGREVLRYEVVPSEERNGDPLVRHGVALFGSPPREPWGRLLQLLPSGGVRDVRHLCDDEVVLGREEGDIVFSDDAFMSRRHAQIAWDGQRALLSDLGSSNGSFVRINGAYPVKHGDHLRMGDQLFRIELRR